MNLNLLQLVSKCFTLAAVSLMSLYNTSSYTETEITVENENTIKDIPVVYTITNYDTVVEYNEKIPSNISNVVNEGVVGLTYQQQVEEETEQESESVVIQQVSDQVIEQGTGNYGIYNGKLVGYGPDCIGCSKEGYTACKTIDNKKFSLVYDGVYYEDSEYGRVRIVAAATQQFPCGTIIEVTKTGVDPFTVIVLDTGSTVKNAWNNGIVLMDLAYSENALAGTDGLTGNNITFSVQRWGW
jgi:3D (Asp-Asp-Asp) domain-containing protein